MSVSGFMIYVVSIFRNVKIIIGKDGKNAHLAKLNFRYEKS